MPFNYDLSDPTDLEMLKSDFDMYSADEWQQFIDFSLLPKNKRSFSYEERGCLMTARKKAVYKGYPSPRQILWALKIVEKVENLQKKRASGEEE